MLLRAAPPTDGGAQGRTQTFNLWFVGPALSQLSYSGKIVVGVGIEPTFRAFQTRANPSQLSDPGHCRLPMFDCRFDQQLSFNRQLLFGDRQCG